MNCSGCNLNIWNLLKIQFFEKNRYEIFIPNFIPSRTIICVGGSFVSEKNFRTGTRMVVRRPDGLGNRSYLGRIWWDHSFIIQWHFQSNFLFMSRVRHDNLNFWNAYFNQYRMTNDWLIRVLTSILTDKRNSSSWNINTELGSKPSTRNEIRFATKWSNYSTSFNHSESSFNSYSKK